MGATPRAALGLGMYVASRAAECPYCSAHTCSFALRRGAVLVTVADALSPGRSLTPREEAVIAVARSIARIPCELVEEEREALARQFRPNEVEGVVFGMRCGGQWAMSPRSATLAVLTGSTEPRDGD